MGKFLNFAGAEGVSGFSQPIRSQYFLRQPITAKQNSKVLPKVIGLREKYWPLIG
jgi:hypothetical protein